jgi:hypothetical protein
MVVYNEATGNWYRYTTLWINDARVPINHNNTYHSETYITAAYATLPTINEKAAKTLTKPDDWLIDFTSTDSANWTPQRRILERGMRIRHFLLPLPPRSR